MDLSDIRTNNTAMEDSDYQLFWLVGGVMVLFYVIIMWVITSADKDRADQLKKIK